MLKALQYLRGLIENDDIIKANLSTYDGEPCVAYQAAPQDMPFPYVVVNVQSNVGEDNFAVDRMFYLVDVYTDNGDIETAALLADRIDHLLNRRKLPTEIGVGIWREAKVPITNEDDLAVQHFHLSFLVRLKGTL